MAILVETALFVCGLASSDCLIASIALWAACISWPLWLWRHPAFLLVWTYLAVTGYFLLLPLAVNTWMMHNIHYTDALSVEPNHDGLQFAVSWFRGHPGAWRTRLLMIRREFLALSCAAPYAG